MLLHKTIVSEMKYNDNFLLRVSSGNYQLFTIILRLFGKRIVSIYCDLYLRSGVDIASTLSLTACFVFKTRVTGPYPETASQFSITVFAVEPDRIAIPRVRARIRLPVYTSQVKSIISNCRPAAAFA